MRVSRRELQFSHLCGIPLFAKVLVRSCSSFLDSPLATQNILVRLPTRNTILTFVQCSIISKISNKSLQLQQFSLQLVKTAATASARVVRPLRLTIRRVVSAFYYGFCSFRLRTSLARMLKFGIT